MNLKICKKCNIEKSVNEYHKQKKGKYGVLSKCKLCCKEYRKNNKEYYKEKNKEYRKNHKEEIKEYFKNYNKNNKEKLNKRSKEHYQNHKEEQKEYMKEYNKNNKEKKKEYNKNNKEKINERIRNRIKNDIKFRTMKRVRGRLYHFLKSNNIRKNNTTIKSIGCSKQQLTDWIKFNLDLDNLVEYHIDHLKPLASFTCKTYEEVIECKCNHWTNLIPTSPEYNLIKHDRKPTKHELFKQELRLYIFKKSLIK
tara:strand:- start:223 stop:978 length:756 start_codon:yes stop_codon:yes gene_type:complete